jgi:hypothetical protein
MFDELWQEIADSPGEIFDIPEMREFAEESSLEDNDDNLYDDLSAGIDLNSNFDF